MFSFQFVSKTCIQIAGLDNLMFESKYTGQKQLHKMKNKKGVAVHRATL